LETVQNTFQRAEIQFFVFPEELSQISGPTGTSGVFGRHADDAQVTSMANGGVQSGPIGQHDWPLRPPADFRCLEKIFQASNDMIQEHVLSYKAISTIDPNCTHTHIIVQIYKYVVDSICQIVSSYI
jgi:hypothetical protein